jgi:hypothetical protein
MKPNLSWMAKEATKDLGKYFDLCLWYAAQKDASSPAKEIRREVLPALSPPTLPV